MNEHAVACQVSTHAPAVTVQTGLLQRTCACGGGAGPSGTCAECRRNRLAGVQPLLQPKLALNHPGDRYEQEADRLAEQVMRMPAPAVQRQVEPEEEEEAVQASPISGQAAHADLSPALEGQINALHGGGQPLDPGVRAFMEPRFSHDFSRVRVHSGARAAQAAQALNARAFTLGHEVFFGAGQYAPGTAHGQRLLAHELTHVVQQRGGDHSTPQAIQRADPDAVSRVGALGRTIGTGIQFWPTNVTDTVVGPVSVLGGLLSGASSRLNVIIGENLTPRNLARQLLPLWTTATPFTPPGGGAPVPLDLIDEETLARGLLVFNQTYLPIPAMTRWQAGLRFPLPVEVDEATGVATLHPTLIRNLAGAFDPAWLPQLDTRTAAVAVPAPAVLTADAAAFLGRETSAQARGIHLGARAQTNASAELPFIQETFRQLGAAGFEVALAFMDHLVNRQIELLAAQRDGAEILNEIRAALLIAPATLTADQQSSLDRANLMLGLVTSAAAAAPPTAIRTRPEKTIIVDTLKLAGSNHNPATDVAVANAVYAQCNIRITHGVNADDSTASPPQTTTWLGGNTDLQTGTSCGSVTNEERRLFRDGSAHYGLGGGRFSAFFVATISGLSASGYSCPPARSPHTLLRHRIVVANGGSTDTLAHEIGHHLINPGSHTPAGSVMAPRPRLTLRLTDWQCNRIYSNA
jgi:hypothetical protein